VNLFYAEQEMKKREAVKRYLVESRWNARSRVCFLTKAIRTECELSVVVYYQCIRVE
jgi:hypothetical protein